jgi:hypothetical protein
MKRLLGNFFYGFLTIALVLSFGHFAQAAGKKSDKAGMCHILYGEIEWDRKILSRFL